MQAQAELGGTATLPGFTSQTLSAADAESQRQSIQSQIDSLQAQLNPPSTGPNSNPLAGLENLFQGPGIQKQITALQTKLSGIPQGGGTIYMDASGNIVPSSQASQSFAGLGTADIEGQIMQELAQGQLTEAQKMDPQFIAEALAQEQQADPQSFAARQQMYNLIQQQINNPPQSPVSNEMEKQVEAKVNAGQNLTPDEQSLLDTAIAQRGGTSAPTDFSQDLTTGFQGEQRGLANAQAGTNWLASGETPEDIQYRAEQQNLANLSNYVSGQTPQSQFKSLSGAQSGPDARYAVASLADAAGQRAATRSAGRFGTVRRAAWTGAGVAQSLDGWFVWTIGRWQHAGSGWLSAVFAVRRTIYGT